MVLVELLRIVIGAADGYAAEAILLGGYKRQVFPVEMIEAGLHFVHHAGAKHSGPGNEGAIARACAVRRARGMIAAANAGERVLPGGEREPRGDAILGTHLI